MPVTSSTDESKTNTVPDPELNPLLNPLLAQHMGRWAEVYFTNPPEKRGEAIAQLLRELEKISTPASASEPASETQRAQAETNSGRQAQVPTTASESWQNDSGFDASAMEPSKIKTSTWEASTSETSTPEAPGFEAPTFLPEPPKALCFHHTCAGCSYVNPPGQFYCGMCGTRLETATGLGLPVTRAAPIFTQSENGAERAVEHDSGEDNSSDYEIASTSVLGSERTHLPGPSSLPREDYFPKLGAESEPSPKNYRLYTGLAVAILFVLLIYMAWRGTRVFTTSTQPVTPAATPSAAAPQTPPEPVSAGQPVAPASENSKTETPVPADADSSRPVPAVAAPAALRSTAVKNQAQPVTSGNNISDSRRTPPVVANAADSSSAALEASGAADFATAQTYLNGDSSTSRNASVAVPLLWRAVGKGNVQAAVTLSDLYLRGDGVAKNCDQARVLLDSAAQKGARAAADRLRNLQAFGCQ